MSNFKDNDIYNGQISRQIFWSDAVFAACLYGFSQLAESGIVHGSLNNLTEI